MTGAERAAHRLTMMILRSAPPSPFGRKVKIAAALLGLTSEITVVTADTVDPADPLRSDNPLGKIPTLVIEDGTVIYDKHPPGL
jgi:glutathione S-transferase